MQRPIIKIEDVEPSGRSFSETDPLSTGLLSVLVRDVEIITVLHQHISETLVSSTSAAEPLSKSQLSRLLIFISRGISVLSCGGTMLKNTNKRIPWDLFEYIKIAPARHIEELAEVEISSDCPILRGLKADLEKCLASVDAIRSKLSSQGTVSRVISSINSMDADEEKKRIEARQAAVQALIKLLAEQSEAIINFQ